jgi:hypothetical protein
VRRALLAAAAALVAVAAVAVAPGPGAAQVPPAVTLRLASQTSWVEPGGQLGLRVVVGGPVDPGDAELAVSVFRRVASRSEFALTLEDRIRGSAISVSAPAPLASLPPDPAGAVQIILPVQDPSQPVDAARLRLREPGVYPVRVELRRTGGGAVLARLVTHLVYATPPDPGDEKLRFALVVPLHAPPALRPDGTRDLPAAERDRLGSLVGSVDAHPLVPVTLKPTPETMQALALAGSSDEAARSTLETLRRATTGRQVMSGTYVPVSPSAFVGEQLEGEAAVQVGRGDRVLADVLGVLPDPRLAVLDEPVDDVAIEHLRRQQVDRLLVADEVLAPVDLPVTLAQPFELDTRDVRRPRALAADVGLRAHFAPRDDPALAAHHLLADLAVLYFDRPGRTRGVAVLPPRDWNGNRAFVDTVLDGLANSPIVTGSTVDAILAEVPPATTGRHDVLRRTPASAAAKGALAVAAALPADRIREARQRIESFAAMLDSDNPRDDALEEQLLVSQSVDVAGRRRTAYLDGIDSRIDAQLALVRVPEARSITLTARRGEIPVTVLNEADYPVRLVVQVASDKLTFPSGGSRRIELPRRNTTERFSVEARSSGAFPLRVQLLSPDGGLLIGESRFTVRSTAFSGVGLVLTVGALGVLLLWWGRHLVRGRRNRRLVAAP